LMDLEPRPRPLLCAQCREMKFGFLQCTHTAPRNAMPGRKPKPTHLKLVQGNPGKRPLNDAEPEPTTGCPKPKFLKGRAAKIWDEYAPELERIGVLTAVDGHMFATWCVLAEEVERDAKGMTASRIAQMRALASSFGLDASSRSRLSVKGADKSKDDKADQYFA
jgi:phage terminase small subunit